MIEFNKKTNTLEQVQYKYTLQDVSEPNLYGIFSVMMKYPSAHSITESAYGTSGRDMDNGYHIQGRSAVKGTLHCGTDCASYDLLHKLGGPKGIIRQCEFFLYSEGTNRLSTMFGERIQYPEVTSWIRATKSDFQLAKDMGMKESGILVSCSDYHIFKKLNMTRKQALEHYMSIVKSAIEVGIRPRCHFEDITRADFTALLCLLP